MCQSRLSLLLLTSLLFACGSTTTATTQTTTGVSSPTCAGFLDDQLNPANAVNIRVVNKRTTSIRVPIECSRNLSIEAKGVSHNPDLGPLGTSCESAMQGQYACCDCDAFTLEEIKPGATWSTYWDGRFYDFEQLPSECQPAGSASNQECLRASTPTGGTMTVVVSLMGADGSGEAFAGKKDFVYGTDTDVEIDVE